MKRKCAVCKLQATRITPAGKGWCGDADCGATLALATIAKQRAAKAKAAAMSHREDKRRVESIGDVLARVQAACNAYIHARDRGKACYTCDATDTRMEAGHWLPVGRSSSPARFHPNNIRLQCHACNVYKGGGNHPNYCPRLTAEIGEDGIADLERLHHSAVKWHRPSLEQLAAWFRAEKRRLDRSSPPQK